MTAKRKHTGAPLKYGEPTIKIHPFYVPESRKAELVAIIKAQLKTWQDDYKATKPDLKGKALTEE